MRYERFIARRYLRSKRQLRFINIIMLVSVIGITVGVAALVIVLSVFNGFNSVVTGVLVGFDPHLRVEPAKGKIIATPDSVMRVLEADRRVKATAPFVAMKALPVSQYPTITPVQITVTTTYPGADAKTVGDSVAAPIEEQINGVEDMLYMSSVSSANGVVEIQVK